MVLVQPFLFSVSAGKESQPDRTDGPVRSPEPETGSKSEWEKPPWFRRCRCLNEKRHRSRNAMPGPSIAGRCKPRPRRKTACHRRTRRRCASGMRSAVHLSTLSTRAPTQAEALESGDSPAPARRPSNNGSRRMRRLPLSRDQTFSAPSAGKTSVRRLEPELALVRTIHRASQRRSPSRRELLFVSTYSRGASCGQLLLPGKQKLKRRHYHHQQNQRYELPRLFAHRNQPLQLFQQTSP